MPPCPKCQDTLRISACTICRYPNVYVSPIVTQPPYCKTPKLAPMDAIDDPAAFPKAIPELRSPQDRILAKFQALAHPPSPSSSPLLTEGDLPAEEPIVLEAPPHPKRHKKGGSLPLPTLLQRKRKRVSKAKMY